MKVLIVSPEIAPFTQISELSYYLSSLSQGFIENEIDLYVMIPGYKNLYESCANLIENKIKLAEFKINSGYQDRLFKLNELKTRQNYKLLTLDSDDFFNRDGYYGIYNNYFIDNGLRFGSFCRASVESLNYINDGFDRIFAFDWQTGLIPVYLKTLEDVNKDNIPYISFVAFNLCNQGLFSKYLVPELEFDWKIFNYRELEFWGQMSFIKGGLVFSDKIIIPLGSSLSEIIEEHMSFGLEDLLQFREDNVSWIKPGSKDHITISIEDKHETKMKLLENMPFSENSLPLIFLNIYKETASYPIVADFIKEALLKYDCNWILYPAIDITQDMELYKIWKDFPHKMKIITGGKNISEYYKSSDFFLFLPQIKYPNLDFMRALKYRCLIIGGHSTGISKIYRDLGLSVSQVNSLHIKKLELETMLKTLHSSLILYNSNGFSEIFEKASKFKRSFKNVAKEYLKK
ncbi:MAG: glycogen/starch synthase [Candidatus Coatesbacteria bacterium]|nr:glycogen/starch synthase [Candidatus Coatesbacteria bacterium]